MSLRPSSLPFRMLKHRLSIQPFVVGFRYLEHFITLEAYRFTRNVNNNFNVCGGKWRGKG